ncbi:hypothetical protein SADUNF_Sadunf12G0102700 [Salix dunnii]|uniref:Uncharacterized protein n=1 Tax=Salix dunnii TaxID=1413687 RepID=A0A835JMK8_9ROSI|nr:hypothetical protein SADUNF_Sadunf12G0102700 [Salix dunnii]
MITSGIYPFSGGNVDDNDGGANIRARGYIIYSRLLTLPRYYSIRAPLQARGMAKIHLSSFLTDGDAREAANREYILFVRYR